MNGDRTAPDSSVLIAGFDPGHPFCETARAALADVKQSGVLIAHTLAESVAVLTGSRYSIDGTTVLAYLADLATRPTAGIAPDAYPDTLAEITRAGIEGGAIYDALIALSARDAGATLVSLDQRAAASYRRCGADFRLLTADAE